jgi:hypothetical protein
MGHDCQDHAADQRNAQVWAQAEQLLAAAALGLEEHEPG